MKKSRKPLTLLLVLVMTLSALPFGAVAAELPSDVVAKNSIPITVKAIDKDTNAEVPVDGATVTLYVGAEAKRTATTDAKGKASILTDGLTAGEVRNATISAYKTISKEKAIDGIGRDQLFNYFPKNGDDYIRVEYELHSETIDQNGNWLGEGIKAYVDQADIVFAIDSTGSMGDVINNVKNNIKKFSEDLIEQGLDIRFSIIEYRDVEEGESTKLHYLNGSHWFTDVSSVEKILSNIDANGGGDTPESALDALGMIASNDMFWRSDAHKFAFLLTDADYKNGNQYGYSGINDVATALKKKDIATSVVTSSGEKDTYSPLLSTGGNIFTSIGSSSFWGDMKSLSDSIISYTVGEKTLILKEPRMLYNVSVAYLANDETSRSDAYRNSLKTMLNEYANDVAETTDGHVLINNVLLFPTDSLMNFFDTSNIASMADIQIQTREKDDGTWWNNVIIHSNSYPGGYYSADPVSSDGRTEKFKHLKDLESYKGRETYEQIQMSGVNWNGRSFIDKPAEYSRELTHESGHYLFWFLDEYLNKDGKNWDRSNKKPIAGNYGLMDNQYDDIELSKSGIEYSYFGDSFPDASDTRHTAHSAQWLMSTEDLLSELLNKGLSNPSLFKSPYKATYSKVDVDKYGPNDRRASYSYSGLNDGDYIDVPSAAMVRTFNTVTNEFFDNVTNTTQSLGSITTTCSADCMVLSLDALEGYSYSLYLQKMGEEGYTQYDLINTSGILTAELPIAVSNLAEVRIVGESDGTLLSNTYYIDRSEETDVGYIYSSADGCVVAYMDNDTSTTYTIIADNTSYKNEDYISINQATRISSDNKVEITGGEIYSVASHKAGIDYSTIQWFKYVDGVWIPLNTDYSTEENLNIGARADLDGEGLYVLMAKLASEDTAEAVTNLAYTQSPDRDAVINLTFDDPNTTTKYYNVYYSDTHFDSPSDENVMMRTYDGESASLTLDLLERGRQVYAAVEVILVNGSKSPLSEIILIGGEADSDGDGIPDWFCDKYALWPKDGEEKDIANSDDDGDGLTNLQEYLGGSDPTDPNDPVNTDNVAVKSISVSPKELMLTVGETSTLTASISPIDATNKTIIWSVDNGYVVSITGDGLTCKIKGLAEGKAIVSAITADGGFAENCVIMVRDKNSDSESQPPQEGNKPQQPENKPEQNNPSQTDGKPNSNTQSPQTGDTRNILLWVALLLASSVGLTVTSVYTRKKRVK